MNRSKTQIDDGWNNILINFVVGLLCVILALILGFFAFLVGAGRGGDERISRNVQYEHLLIDRYEKDRDLLDRINAELGGWQ